MTVSLGVGVVIAVVLVVLAFASSGLDLLTVLVERRKSPRGQWRSSSRSNRRR